MQKDNEDYKICDICKVKTNCAFDTLLFGDWQCSRDITVHYFCLLLSTHLPQLGQDNSGINGFLLRDIRNEIHAATKRVCCFCAQPHASIRCHKCKDYFHLVCGRSNRCLFQFCNEFRSFCNDCIPVKELYEGGMRPNATSHERCTICRDQMGQYNPVVFIYGKCCSHGYAHNVCVQKYALAAGYYLRCIWCRSPEFRETVRMQGIFVPDRDAQWERQHNAYKDLHVGHRRCDMENCWCPKGRDYVTGKWSIILCSLCGGTGAHNPVCIPGKEQSKQKVETFKCNICANTETAVAIQNTKQSLREKNDCDLIDHTIFMNKKSNNCGPEVRRETISFSDEESQLCSDASVVTVIPRSALQIAAKRPNAIPSWTNVNNENRRLSAEPVTETVAATAPTTVSSFPSITIDNEEVAAEAIIETQLPYVRLNDSTNCENTPNVATNETKTLDKTKVLCSATTQIEPSPEIPHSGEQSGKSGSTQSPVISSTSQGQDVEPIMETFDMYEYDLDANKCVGTVALCINLNDERFAGQTLEQIQSAAHMLKEEDVVARSDDTGIFAVIDSIIAQYK